MEIERFLKENDKLFIDFFGMFRLDEIIFKEIFNIVFRQEFNYDIEKERIEYEKLFIIINED